MQNSRAFTLLEMAIVLVIIALLMAGIVVGRNMEQEATKQAVIAEIDKYSRGVHQFKDIYGQLPGDFNGAEAIWGSDAGCPNTNWNTVPKVSTCNGDGDGTIGDWNGTTFNAPTEWYRAWQQMADAGVIDGQFSGVGGNQPSQLLFGVSMPGSVYANGGYTLLFRYNSTLSTEDFPFTGQHVLEYGAVDSNCAGGGGVTNCITHGPLLTPSDALEIDAKIDDGMPATGIVMSHPNSSVQTPTCTNGTSSTAQYNVSDTNFDCALIISTGL